MVKFMILSVFYKQGGDIMDARIIIVLVMNFIISLIGTLAYSVRLVGVRTGKIAISFALFNVLMLVSRLAVTIQNPILSKFVETGAENINIVNSFNLIIIISGVASIVGAFLIPSFQRILGKGVESFSEERSFQKLIIHSFSKSGIKYVKNSIAIPVKESITSIDLKKFPKRIIVLNIIIVAASTVGALAPIYAGSLQPDLGKTCMSLSALINGVATILMTLVTDPQLSMMTDDVMEGKCTEEDFRTCVIGMVGSKAIGTFLALFLLVPASYIIIFVAKII